MADLPPNLVVRVPTAADVALLTPYQRQALHRLRNDSRREQHDGGPWVRGWVRPGTPAESRAMAALAAKGLVECKPGRKRAKIPAQYRYPGPVEQW